MNKQHQQMMEATPLPVRSVKRYRMLVTALSFAVVAGVMEVMVRFGVTATVDQVDQLAFSVFGNVATLGLATVVSAGILRALLGLILPKSSEKSDLAQSRADGLVLGTVAVLIVLQTGLFGLNSQLSRQWLTVPVAIVAGFVAFGIVRQQYSTPTQQTRRLIGIAIPAVWLICCLFTVIGFYRAHGHWQAWTRTGNGGHLRTQAESSRPNILLVVIDTLRADKVGVYGGPKLTPNIDRFAEKATVYPNSFTTAPWTLPSHASLFTGMYPKELRVNWGNFALDDRFPTLASLFRDHGYETWGISNNELLGHTNGYDRGFDVFVETSWNRTLRQCDVLFKCGTWRPVARLLGLAPEHAEDKGSAWTNWLVAERLKNRQINNKPFFAFLNYYDVHDPYTPPQEFLDKFLSPQEQEQARRVDMRRDSLVRHSFLPESSYCPSEIAILEKLYDANVAYQDKMIGDLLQRLKECGVYDNTWIVITSDHGELFGEQGMIHHVAGNHHKLLHVPTIVRSPNRDVACRIETPVQPVDIFATLLAAAGIEKPAHCDRAYVMPLGPGDASQRKVCVAQTYGAAIFGMYIAQRQHMLVDLDHWLTWIESIYEDGHLLEQESSGIRRLYDVTQDPDMGRDLSRSQPDVTWTLVDDLRKWSELRLIAWRGMEPQPERE